MTRKTLLIFALAITFVKIQAQERTTTNWLSKIETIKSSFYLKDTIPIKIDEKFTGIFRPGDQLVRLKTENCKTFFRSEYDSIDCLRDGKYLYSFYISKSNYVTLTFLSIGKYSNYLILYNYSPEGKILTESVIEGSAIDEDSGEHTKTIRKDRSAFIVTKCQLAENDTEACLRKTYEINSKGIINEVAQEKFTRELK